MLGHPGGKDGKYLVISNDAAGKLVNGGVGTYSGGLEIAPLESSYRPPSIPRPVALPVTAKGGQVGDASHMRVTIPFRVPVPPLVEVCANGASSCGRTAEGDVYCCGSHIGTQLCA